MAIFDFRCKTCSKEFEKIVKTDQQVVCECGSTEVEKLISATRESGVILKGDGFYKKSPSSW